MTRKDDLEQWIRECYELIREYEKIGIRLSDDPLERKKAEDKIEDAWNLIHSYLEPYLSICRHLGLDLAPDIFEIAIHIDDIDRKIRSMKAEREASGSDLQIPMREDIQPLRGSFQRLQQSLDELEQKLEGRRLPIYLLLSTSSSMAGSPIQAVNQGVNLLYNRVVA